MGTSTLNKNGTIHLPADIQKHFQLMPGDKISFVNTLDGIMVIPLKKVDSLIKPNERSIANKACKEITMERIFEDNNRLWR